jgi:CHAD domain-containing protein
MPVRQRERVAETVHDLRTASRRLLAVLTALRPFQDGKAARRLCRRAEKFLDRSGSLRDLGVQLDMLPTVTTDSSADALRRLEKRLIREHERMARKLRRRLRREGVGRLRDDLRRVVKRSCRALKSLTPSAIQKAALKPGQESFARLRQSRLAVDPTARETIHHMRIALKEFRYLMESLRVAARGITARDLESLHALQTTMGDLHDLEVLSSTIAHHVAKRAPESAATLALVLEQVEVRHSAMLTSFLEAVDPILDSWERVLAGRRQVIETVETA